MKSTALALLPLLLSSVQLHAGQRLIPAGSLVQCTVSEPKISSRTEAVGDPVLCQVGAAGYAHSFGTAILPYASYLGGRFEDYKDPGHFVGKGWMLLKFDRLVIEPDMILPVNVKLVGVPGYRVDHEGRIRGKGHAVRDTVEWTIPILWPIDLLDLPRRGPRPTLKAETRLVLKVMDDVAVPTGPAQQQDPSGLYYRAPSSYTPSSPDENLQKSAPAPLYSPRSPGSRAAGYSRVSSDLLDPAQPQLTPAVAVTPAPATVPRAPYLSPGAAQTATAQNAAMLIFKDGRPPERVDNFVLTPTTVYVQDPSPRIIPVSDLDLAATSQVNRQAGVDFRVPERRPSRQP